MNKNTSFNCWLWLLLPVVAVTLVLPVLQHRHRAEGQDSEQIQQALAEVKGKTLAGETVTLEQFKGRPLLIHFFTTWCGNCRGEITRLKTELSEAGDGAPQMLAISLDRNPKDVMYFLDGLNLDWPVIRWGKGMMDPRVSALGVSMLPKTMLLDSAGHLVDADVMANDLSKAWEQLPTAADSASLKKARSKKVSAK
jgi:thiol-disulfide isomerase/thioredoxin